MAFARRRRLAKAEVVEKSREAVRQFNDDDTTTLLLLNRKQGENQAFIRFSIPFFISSIVITSGLYFSTVSFLL